MLKLDELCKEDEYPLFGQLVTEKGVALNIAADDLTNAMRLCFIVRTYLEWQAGEYPGHVFQISNRTGDNWENCESLPVDFNQFRYRMSSEFILD